MSGEEGESSSSLGGGDHKRITMLGNPETVKEWDKEANEMGMSRSEFIRSMVNAGRRQIAQLDPKNNSDGENLKKKVLAEIPDDGAAPVEEIVQQVVGPIEKEITEEILPNLDENNEIRYNPKEKGYEKI